MLIAHRQRNERLRTGENLLRLAAFIGVAFEPEHFAVLFLREPVLKFLRAGRRRGGREMAVVKAQFLRALTDGVLHRGGRVASLNCKATWVATSRAERRSVLMSTSACR